VPPFLFRAAGDVGQQMVLGLFDVDGERWGVFGEAGKLRYLQASHGLVFVVDPLQIHSVRQMLRTNNALPADALRDDEIRDQDIAINSLIKALQLHASSEGQYPTPIAVVLSKGDVLWRTDSVLRDSLWDVPFYHPGGQRPRYDMALHWRVQFAVREFLLLHAEGLVSKIEKRFANVAYFCVAPTGCDAGTGRFARFAPWRVEEPVLWLFMQLGIIPPV